MFDVVLFVITALINVSISYNRSCFEDNYVNKHEDFIVVEDESLQRQDRAP
jgi:hypothetical protein